MALTNDQGRDDVTAPQRGMIRGRVLDGSAGVAGAIVTAFARDLRRKPVQLRSTESSDDGSYEIAFDFDESDADGRASMELVVRVVRAGTSGVLGEASAFVARGAGAVIDVVLAAPSRSEWEVLTDTITPLLVGQDTDGQALQPADLDDTDVLRITAMTRLDAEQVRLWVSAAVSAQDALRMGLAGIEPAAFYAWFRQGMSQTGADVLLRPTDELMVALDRSVARAVVPAMPDNVVQRLREQIDANHAEVALRPSALGERATLADLLDSSPLTKKIGAKQRLALARASIAMPDRGPDFWAAVKPLRLSAATTAALHTTFAVEELSGGDPNLVRALQTHLPAKPDGTLAHLASLTPNDWIATATMARPDASMEVIERTASALTEAIERSHSSLSFKARLDSGGVAVEGYPTEKVSNFLGEHADFDLQTTSVEPFLIDCGLDGDSELKSAVLQTQRVLRMGATHSEAVLLMKAGVASADAVTGTDGQTFAALLGGSISDARLAVIRRTAYHIVRAVIGIASTVSPVFAGPGTRALAPPAPSADVLTRFPSIGAIFGDPSFCACRECMSVLGPAAYLVDLLRMLPSATEEDLRRRRPDIAQLELTCENTNTEIPYVDLVLEVLESAIVFPSAPIILTSAEQAALTSGQVPASVRAALAATVSVLDPVIAVLQSGGNSAAPDASGQLVFSQDFRRWPARRWHDRLTVSYPDPSGVSRRVVRDVPDADRDTVVQALRLTDTVPALIVNLVAPEPRLPVSGTPTTQRQDLGAAAPGQGTESWDFHVDREVAVAFTPGSPVGVLHFRQLDDTPIESIQLEPGSLVPTMAAYLNQGHIPQYISNLLPPLRYKVRADPARSRWIVSASMKASIRYDAARLIVDGLSFVGSDTSRDLTVFAENRNPEAYTILAGSKYPWTLPYDVFLDEVRACLAVMGTSRLELIRALRPGLRNTGLVDTCELLQTTPQQIQEITTVSPTAAQSAEWWGLQVAGNALAEPSGDLGAPPIPTGWLGALGRLSILLDRARLELPALLGALSARYVVGAGPAPTLDPIMECRASRVRVTGFDEDPGLLDRLHRFLRLRRITGWSLRDLDVAVAAVTGDVARPLDDDSVTAVAAIRELAERLDVPVRRASAWVGPLETGPFTDHEVEGGPVLPSLYDETYLRSQFRRVPDGDFALDAGRSELAYITAQGPAPVLKTLTEKLTELATALHARPTDLRVLIASAATPQHVDDTLTLQHLVELYRHLTLAAAIGLTIAEYQLLASLNPQPLFPDPPHVAAPARTRAAQLLSFCDLVDDVRASGFSVDELALFVGATVQDVNAERERALDRSRWLGELQAALRAVQPVADTDISDVEIGATLATVGWPAAAVDKLVAAAGDDVGFNTTLDVRVSVALASAPHLPAGSPFVVLPEPAAGHFSVIAPSSMLTSTPAEVAASFSALAGVANLGPLANASSPAARLKVKWDQMDAGVARLTSWLQSLELPVSRTPLRFTITAPQGLASSTVPGAIGGTVRLLPAGPNPTQLEIRGFLSASQRIAVAAWAASATNPAFFTELAAVPTLPGALASPAGRLRYDASSAELVLVGYLDPPELPGFMAVVDHPQFAAAVQQLAATADTYVEHRASYRLMGASTVRATLAGEPAPQGRYRALQQAALQPTRRLLAARLAAQRAGIDISVFEFLDVRAQVGSTGLDVLAPICATDFVAADLQAQPPAPAWTAAVAEVDRVALPLRHFGVRSTERSWFDHGEGFKGLADLGFEPPAADPAAIAAQISARFGSWQRTACLFRLQSALPAQADTLETIRQGALVGTGDPAADLDAAFAIIETAFELPDRSAISALRLDGLITGTADLLDPLKLRSVVDAARILRRLGSTVGTSVALCGATLGEAEARAARGLFAAKYGPEAGSDGLRAAMNLLRERQRTAVVDYLIQTDGVNDAADLHARYLLDVEMGAEMATSRVKQAISSTQLFIQRWLMNLEGSGLPPAPDDIARSWELMRSYRVWEANRRVFLYPENWLEPSLRDDKTHLFRRLESSLLQSEVTSERAIEALQEYLDGLHDMSRVTVIAMYREDSGPRAGTVHMVGRTSHRPVQYFYRLWHPIGSAGSWDPWEPVDVIGETDHVVVFVHNGRPRIAWLQVEDAKPEDIADAHGAAGADPSTVWALQLQWTQRGQAGWPAPKKSANKITHIKAINKDADTTFALRVIRSSVGDSTIVCYGGSTDLADPAPDPVAWQGTPKLRSDPEKPPDWETIYAQLIDVQVLGKDGTRLVPLTDAVIEYWAATGDDSSGPFVYGSASNPWRMYPNEYGAATTSILVPKDQAGTDVKLHISVRGKHPGQPDQSRTFDVEPAKLNDAMFGFVFDITTNTAGAEAPQLDPARHLHLVPIAAADWGLGLTLNWSPEPWRPGNELPPVGIAEHFCSGYRFPAEAPIALPLPGTLTWQAQTIQVGTSSKPVFVSAVASETANVVQFPFYLEAESAAACGFVTGDPKNPVTFLPASEVTHVALQRGLDAGTDQVTLSSTPLEVSTQVSVAALTLNPGIVTPYDSAKAQFPNALPYSVYDWELFFHTPVMVAGALATNQRFAEALRWLQLVFDPTRSDPSNPASPSWWRFQPFADAGQGIGIDVLLKDFSAERLSQEQHEVIAAQIAYSRNSPFRPFGIARARIRAFQWMAFLKYVDILIAWGDQLFGRDTIESINQATQLYVLAWELLGRRSTEMTEQEPLTGPPTFASENWDDFSNAWVSLADLPFFQALAKWLAAETQNGTGDPAVDWYLSSQLRAMKSIGSLVFCVPHNDRIESYWDLVQDRLFKIRHSQNIDGVQRRLALFEPPIDPALLVRAVAAGLDIESVLNETFAPRTPYRFSAAMQTASQVCAEVKSLGGALLSAWEKRDAEDLARLRSTQERALLDLIGDSKRRQLDEAQANLTALRHSRASAEVRYRHYQRLLGKDQIVTPAENAPVASDAPRLQLVGSTSDQVDADLRGYGLTLEEVDQLGWATDGNTYSTISGTFQVAAGIAHAVPNFNVGAAPYVTTFGGSNIGSSLGAVGQGFSVRASNASFNASRSAIIGGHQRRYDDWILQSNLSGKEIEQIDRQVLAAEIRVDLAQREIAQHERQVANAEQIDDFLRAKFTSQELYQWMIDRLSEAHSAAYQVAYGLARRAQRAFAFELGVADPGIINFGAWDGLHSGLLSGERLSLDLARLEAAYRERNRRELEITKYVSVNDLDPMALLDLQTNGSCEFTIHELVYDLDFPGHYFRRIQSVSVTVPCVVGTYATVAGTLTLLENKLRADAAIPRKGEDAQLSRDLVPIQSIATSSGRSDTGLFELNFRDERYLPFEGAGAISHWRFELPSDFRSFDYSTISDLVLQVRYTARDGGQQLKEDAITRVRKALADDLASIQAAGDEGALIRAVSLRRDFPDEWNHMTTTRDTPQTITIGMDRFPYAVKDETLAIFKVSIFARGAKDTTKWHEVPVKLTAPASAYPDDGDPDTKDTYPISPTPVDVADGVGLYEISMGADADALLSVAVTGTTPTQWQLEILSAAPALTDLVIAFWWRLES